jgi:hypothetical protein
LVPITSLYTDKKENQIFLIYKEIQNGAVAKSYMTNGHLILLGPPGCAQNIPLLEPGSPRFFWWYENSE